MSFTPLSMSKLKKGAGAEAISGESPPLPDGTLEDKVVHALKSCFDPELPVNIYELGLIYKLEVDPDSSVRIQMTLTTPACPVAGTLPGQVQAKVAAIPGVGPVKVDLVWDPPWDMSRMSDAAKLELGLY